MRLSLVCFYCLRFLFFLSIATMSFASYFLVRSLLSAFPAYLRTFFRFDLVWFRLSCDHGCIRSRTQRRKHSTNCPTYHMQARQPDSVDPYSCYICNHTYMFTNWGNRLHVINTMKMFYISYVTMYYYYYYV